MAGREEGATAVGVRSSSLEPGTRGLQQKILRPGTHMHMHMRMLDMQNTQYHITPGTSEGKRSPRTEWEGGGGRRLSPRHIMDSRAAGALRHAAQLPVARSILGAGAPHTQTPSAEDGKDGVTWEEGAGAVGVCSSSTSRSREVKRSLMASLYTSISLQISFCKVPQFW